MKNNKTDTYFYSDELEDEFVKTSYRAKTIDGAYKYAGKNVFFKLFSFICYRVVCTPIAFIYSKIIRNIKFVNKKALKQCKNQGYFIYANHTQPVSDAFTPSIITFPRQVYTVVSPQNLAIPFLGKLTKFLGALPLPETLESNRNFLNTLEAKLKRKKAVLIYPEAHIWPYYTKIRPFKSVSFKYAVKFGAPVFSFTTTYQKTQRNRLKTVVYVDGPFYADGGLPPKLRQEELRDRVFDAMCGRAKNSNYEKVKYIKTDKEKN